MKFLLLTLNVLLVACSTYHAQPVSVATGITTEKQAIEIASQEISRRRLTLPPGATTSVKKGTVMVEVGPDIPIYVISFYAPNRRKSRPVYVVSVEQQSGRIEDFTDTSKLIPVEPAKHR